MSVRRPSRPISTATRKNETRIGDGSRIGAGAILVAPVTIGRDAVVGANAVVTKGHDVADGQTVIGIPAHPLKTDSRRESGSLHDEARETGD